MASPRSRASKVATAVRQRITAEDDRVWRFTDFDDLPFAAVAQALSRLVKTDELQRLRRGLYYRARPTAFGPSLPNPAALQELVATKAPVFPAGLAAANLLGFTTQNGARAEIATTATSLPRSLVGETTVVHTRRPLAWNRLRRDDGALLDFLRHAGRTSELAPAATTERTLELLADDGCLARLVDVAITEPPRVRALLGALAEQLEAKPSTLARLRASLHTLSRFDFGPFVHLPNARAWQAKTAATP